MEGFKKVARETRLELATSAVTGRRSNQLSYSRALNFQCYGRDYINLTFKSQYLSH